MELKPAVRNPTLFGIRTFTVFVFLIQNKVTKLFLFNFRQNSIPLPARSVRVAQQADRSPHHLHERPAQDPLKVCAQEVCYDVKGGQHQGMLKVLRGQEPVQRVQVPLRVNASGHLPDAVVRPPQQVHAP